MDGIEEKKKLIDEAVGNITCSIHSNQIVPFRQVGIFTNFYQAICSNLEHKLVINKPLATNAVEGYRGLQSTRNQQQQQQVASSAKICRPLIELPIVAPFSTE